MSANAAEQLSHSRPDWSRVVFFNSDAQPTNTLLNPRPRQEEGLLSLLLISRRTCFDFVTRSLIQFAVFRVEAKKQQPKKNPKHCPAFSLHRHSCSPLTQWWYQCCSALSRLPEMICRFYWLHLKIFTGCCSTTNPGLTCLLADPFRLFTHKRATGFCSMWIRTGSTVRRRPLSCRHSEEFCCREKLNFNKCSLTSRREQKLKRSVVVDHSQPVQHHCWTEQNLHGTLRKVLQKGIQGSGRKTTSHCVSKVAAWENNRPITAESKYLSEEETGLNTSRAEPDQNNAERQNHWPHTSIHRQYCVMTAGIVW